LQGYTPSTVSIRRGSVIYTYNEKGSNVQSHPAGPPVPKNKPAPPAASKRIAAPAAAPTSWWPAPAPTAPVVQSRRAKVQPLIETDEEIDTTDFEDDSGTDDDVQISEMTEAIPDEVRGLILMLELESSLISERVTAGMKAAEARGKHLGRPATSSRIVSEIETIAASTDLSIRQIQRKIAGRASRGIVGEITKRARDIQSSAL
jgi:hypothetical protein